jgi:MFS family permease
MGAAIQDRIPIKRRKQWAQQFKIVFLSSFTWFIAGFDFLLLPLLGKEIGSAFFPNIDPTQTILAVYGVFSLSLLARVFGGIVFGKIADANGQRPVITICLLSLTVLMFMSAILPGVHSTFNILLVPVVFTLTRLGIGFFVGALWPTAAIFGMERLYEKCQEKHISETDKNNSPSESEATKCDSKQSWGEGDPKKSTIQSALMQLGFHAGVGVSVAFIIILIPVCSSYCDIYFHFTPYFQFKDAFVWRTMCIIGGLLGIIWSFIFIKYSPKEMKNGKKNKDGQRDPIKEGTLSITRLLTDTKYEEIRKSLFNFWLILSGLMYMYYSNIVILPEIIRDNLLMPYSLGNGIGFYPFVNIIFIVSTIGAHFWLGFYCRAAWQRGPRSMFFSLPIVLRKWYWKVSEWLSELIGFKSSKEYPELSENIIKENVDLLVIIFIGVILIIAGTIGFVLYLFTFHYGQKPRIYLAPVLYTLIPVTMIANAGWALIPSMLTSRFPTNLRNTCSALVYNGGLVIGFASPFIM